MKIKAFPFILMLFCALAFAIPYASAEREATIVLEFPEKGIIAESKLPGTVEIIEEEAFEGTALIKVELPNAVFSIGERAFAGISTLREVIIPISTKYIANNAFEDSNRMTITAPINSYAKTYARNRGIPFTPIIILCASSQIHSESGIFIIRSIEVVDGKDVTVSNPETQWRRIEELDIIRIEELIANHVQGRAPPVA